MQSPKECPPVSLVPLRLAETELFLVTFDIDWTDRRESSGIILTFCLSKDRLRIVNLRPKAAVCLDPSHVKGDVYESTLHSTKLVLYELYGTYRTVSAQPQLHTNAKQN